MHNKTRFNTALRWEQEAKSLLNWSLSLSLACARALWADLSRPLLGLQRRCHAAALYPALDQAHQHHHVDWAHQLDSDHIELTDNDENIAARCSLKQRSLPGYLTPFFKIWFLWMSWWWFFFMIVMMIIILYDHDHDDYFEISEGCSGHLKRFLPNIQRIWNTC